MRFATIEYSHPDGWFQSIGEDLGTRTDVTPVAIHSSQLLTDGTAVMLTEYEGNADAVRRILDENEQTNEFQVTRLSDCIAAYIHYTPTETVKKLMRIPDEYGLVVDTPMPFHDDVSFEATIIGPPESISKAFEEIPEPLTKRVERVGSYTPEEVSYFDTLSDRQREVFRMAYERGYYEEPREVTHADIAENLDCSKGNVGEILRRIENNLVDQVFEQASDSGRVPSPFRST